MSYIGRISHFLEKNYWVKGSVELGSCADLISASVSCYSRFSEGKTIGDVRNLIVSFFEVVIPLGLQCRSYKASLANGKWRPECAAHLCSLAIKMGKAWYAAHNKGKEWRLVAGEVVEIVGHIFFAFIDLSQYSARWEKGMGKAMKITVYLMSYSITMSAIVYKIYKKFSDSIDSRQKEIRALQELDLIKGKVEELKKSASIENPALSVVELLDAFREASNDAIRSKDQKIKELEEQLCKIEGQIDSEEQRIKELEQLVEQAKQKVHELKRNGSIDGLEEGVELDLLKLLETIADQFKRKDESQAELITTLTKSLQEKIGDLSKKKEEQIAKLKAHLEEFVRSKKDYILKLGFPPRQSVDNKNVESFINSYFIRKNRALVSSNENNNNEDNAESFIYELIRPDNTNEESIKIYKECIVVWVNLESKKKLFEQRIKLYTEMKDILSCSKGDTNDLINKLKDALELRIEKYCLAMEQGFVKTSQCLIGTNFNKAQSFKEY